MNELKKLQELIVEFNFLYPELEDCLNEFISQISDIVEEAYNPEIENRIISRIMKLIGDKK